MWLGGLRDCARVSASRPSSSNAELNGGTEMAVAAAEAGALDGRGRRGSARAPSGLLGTVCNGPETLGRLLDAL